MTSRKDNFFKVLFIISFIPLLIVICLSLYYSIVGKVYNSWLEPYDTYTAYGLEEFCNSIFYYGGYLTFVVPLFEVCFFYQIYYIVNKINQKRNVSE